MQENNPFVNGTLSNPNSIQYGLSRCANPNSQNLKKIIDLKENAHPCTSVQSYKHLTHENTRKTSKKHYSTQWWWWLDFLFFDGGDQGLYFEEPT